MEIVLIPPYRDIDTYGPIWAYVTAQERKNYMGLPLDARKRMEKIIKKELEKARKKAGKR